MRGPEGLLSPNLRIAEFPMCRPSQYIQSLPGVVFDGILLRKGGVVCFSRT